MVTRKRNTAETGEASPSATAQTVKKAARPAAEKAPAKAKAIAAKPAAKPVRATATPKVSAKVRAEAAKPAAKKAPAARARKVAPATQALPPIAPEQRRNYIEVAAFYIAQRRNFAPGDVMTDWLAAELEIDALIAAGKLGS